MDNRGQRRALVTGATGFIGSHIVKKLVKDDWNVHIIVRPHSNLDIIKDVADRIIIYKYDGNTATMIDIVRKAKPDIVFHLASLFLAQHKPEEIEPLIRSNILFGTQLVEAMTTNRIEKLINTGTSWQHYNNEDYNPVCLYAATKQAFEDILRFYIQAHRLQAVTLKLFDTYGPGDPRPKLFSFLKNSMNTDEPIDFSPGEQLLDMLYINDVVDAFEKAIAYLIKKSDYNYESFFIGSGIGERLKEVVSIFEEIVGMKLKINWGGRPYRQREVMIAQADISQAKEKLGWQPRVSLREGIEKMLKEEGVI